MNIKMEIFWNVPEQFSVKVKNKVAKTNIDLNFSIIYFFFLKKTRTKVNRILLKII